MTASLAGSAPLAPEDRYETLDVLRGFALFGVFLMNFLGFAQWIMATDAQMLALPTVGVDAALRWVILWLVGEKANTLFAFLFGLGFSIQMQRLQGRGAPFKSVYMRRLAVLLVIGVVHQVFFWNWDILHLYALAGFALFAMRNASDRVLLGVGVPLALFARPLVDAVAGALGLQDLPGREAVFGEAAVLERQALSAAGDYPGLLENFTKFMWYDYIASAVIVGWFGYALGRFLIGHWVGRRDYLTHPGRYLPGYRRLLRFALPTGLIVCGIGILLELHERSAWLAGFDSIGSFADAIHLLGTPFLACGYLCAIVLGLNATGARRWLLAFAPVGRMALTNYLAQTLVYAWVLFGVGPGLGLAGRLGTLSVTAIVTIGFAAQIAFSHWWLARFRFGPAEWLWRALTYGEWPRLRLSPATDASSP
jgi:uncharacterized protein